MSAPADRSWPGSRFGLPASGPRSLARLGRRVGGLAIDWALASIVSFGLFWSEDPTVRSWYTLAIWAGVTMVFELVFVGSPGHLILGMRVVPLRGGRLAFWQPIVRTLLLAIVIPAILSDGDGRALHDRAAGTILVRV